MRLLSPGWRSSCIHRHNITQHNHTQPFRPFPGDVDTGVAHKGTHESKCLVMRRSSALSALSCDMPVYSQNAGQESLTVPSQPICSLPTGFLQEPQAQHSMPQLGSLFHVDPPKASPAGCPVPTLALPVHGTAATPPLSRCACPQAAPARCRSPSPYGGCRASRQVLQGRPSSCTQCGLADGLYTSEHLPSWLHPLLVLPCPSLLMASLAHHTGIYFYQHGPPDPHISNLAI